MRTFTKQNYLRKYNGLWNIGIGLSERSKQQDTFDLNSFYNFNEMTFSWKHCRESPVEFKERRRRTRRARNIRLQSFLRNLFDFEDSNASSTTPWTTRKMPNENL